MDVEKEFQKIDNELGLIRDTIGTIIKSIETITRGNINQNDRITALEDKIKELRNLPPL